ncbi:6256_t:CDS:10, partial [Acaulospora colombiana]
MEIDKNESLTSGSDLSENDDLDQAIQTLLSETIPSLLEQMWLEWIEDESRLAVTQEEKQNVINLFSEAVKDYLSINIWSAYSNYVLNEYKSSLDQMNGVDERASLITIEYVRKVFEEACKETGYVITESHKIWDPYREFEEKIMEHINLKTCDYFFVAIEKTFSDYSSFITKYENVNYEKCMIEANSFFSKTKVKYYKMDKYEQELSTSGFALYKFIEYIEHETKQPNSLLPAIRCLYERAIAYHYLDPSLWENYIFYLVENKVSYDDTLKILERKKRAIMESYDEIKNIFQRALSTGMLNSNVDELVKVVVANCDLERRRVSNEELINSNNSDALKSAIKEGLRTVEKAFKNGDPLYRLERYLIEIETLTGCTSKAREMWERVIKHHRNESGVWLRYADWEKSLGNLEETRKKFRKASQQDTDWPEQIFDAWEQFEHQYGTLETLETAQIFMRKQMKNVKKRRAKALEQAEIAQLCEQFQAEQDVQPAENSKHVGELDSSTTDQKNDAKKRKHEDDSQIDGSPFEKRNKSAHADRNKRDREFSTIVVRNLPSDITKGQLKALLHECGKIVEIRLIEDSEKSNKYAYIEFASRDDVPAALTKDKKKVGENEIDVYRIFQHILYITNFTESTDLNKLFKKYGEIIEIRFPSKNWRAGRFCYIEYKNRESTQAALEMDGYEIEPGRKLKVMISNPSLKKTRSPPIQKEIFIRNLPSRVEISELEEFFKTCGKVIKVRIPKTKDNRCKGVAFVEFDTEV